MICWNGVTIDRQRGRIEHRGLVLQFTPDSAFFRLACALLMAGPSSKEDLFLHVYADREDGGPLGGIRTFDVLMCLLRKRLLRIGIELCADAPWSWHRKRYWAAPMILPLRPWLSRKAGDPTERLRPLSVPGLSLTRTLTPSAHRERPL